jgi:hypothetical protein
MSQMLNNLKSEKMKSNAKFTGLLLMLLIAGNISISAQRGNRGGTINKPTDRMVNVSDTLKRPVMNNRFWAGPQRMDQMQRFNDDRGMYGNGRGMAPGRKMNGMGRGMGPGSGMNGMGRRMGPGRGFGMGREFGPDRRDSIAGRQFGPGRMMLESIPNVTEKQKKEISDLMTIQREEMTKFRDEMQAKMKEMRESQRKSMLNILTDEQKKFIEQGTPKTPSAPAVKK